MQKYIVILLICILSGCVGNGFKRIEPDCDFSNVYQYRAYLHETAFCLRCDGSIYNFKHGFIFFVDLPVCDVEDIPVHTHPFLGETGANYIDGCGFGWYMGEYGNDTFGVLPCYGPIAIYRYGG